MHNTSGGNCVDHGPWWRRSARPLRAALGQHWRDLQQITASTHAIGAPSHPFSHRATERFPSRVLVCRLRHADQIPPAGEARSGVIGHPC